MDIKEGEGGVARSPQPSQTDLAPPVPGAARSEASELCHMVGSRPPSRTDVRRRERGSGQSRTMRGAGDGAHHLTRAREVAVLLRYVGARRRREVADAAPRR